MVVVNSSNEFVRVVGRFVFSTIMAAVESLFFVYFFLPYHCSIITRLVDSYQKKTFELLSLTQYQLTIVTNKS